MKIEDVKVGDRIYEVRGETIFGIYNVERATKTQIICGNSSRLAGHSEISVTQRYICSDDKANQSVQNYFAQFQTEEKLYI